MISWDTLAMERNCSFSEIFLFYFYISPKLSYGDELGTVKNIYATYHKVFIGMNLVNQSLNDTFCAQKSFTLNKVLLNHHK